MVQPFFSLLDLGLTLWKGEYETYEAIWLRWCTAGKNLLPTGKESALTEKTRADQLAVENARLLERLKAAGLEPG